MQPTHVVEQMIRTADALVRRLDGSLSAIKGITYSEYQLLSAMDGSESAKTRVLLAQRVGLTPSGVTRALKPLEKLGFVETVKDERDARRSIARLTDAGSELLSDAKGVVEDTLQHLEDALDTDEKQRFTQVLDVISGMGEIRT